MSVDEIFDSQEFLSKSRIRGTRSLEACGTVSKPFQPHCDLDHKALREGAAFQIIVEIHVGQASPDA